MFIKIIVLCAASASLLYTIMYAAVSSYYHKTNGRASGAASDEPIQHRPFPVKQ